MHPLTALQLVILCAFNAYWTAYRTVYDAQPEDESWGVIDCEPIPDFWN